MPVHTTALIVGARTVRQGTGPFLAAALHKLGVQITSVVGTTPDTAAEAARSLQTSLDINTRSYDDLAEALVTERPEFVVLCSPWQYHEAQLGLIASAGCHCLVEKPLLWPGSEDTVASVIRQFESKDLLLQVVAQWPFALPQFESLFGPSSQCVDAFNMRLSPISLGPIMVPDAAPHFLSLLQALVGPGDCQQVSIELSGEDRLSVQCRYKHARGSVRAELELQTVAQRPRPAWIEINGQRAERKVELPDYRQFLSGAGRQIALPDPMEQVAADFIGNLRRGGLTDRPLLMSLQRNLCTLSAAWPS